MSNPELRSESESTGSVGPDEAWMLEGGRIRVLTAGAGEVDLVAGILDEAALWLESRGLGQWPRPFPVEWIRSGLAVGTCYLAWDGLMPVGTFSLQPTDPAFWGERPNEPPNYAMYLHRLAVRRSHRGLGRSLLDYAQVLTRMSGAVCLRLDCMAANPRIRTYYEAAGFEHRGDVDVRGRLWRASLYEKVLVQDRPAATAGMLANAKVVAVGGHRFRPRR